jgi:nitrite reductase/ring-hydroxylating ferredoxin subunit
MVERAVGPEGEVRRARGAILVNVDGREIGIFETGGEFRAYESRCPHQGGPVCRGQLIGRVKAAISDGGAVGDERFDDSELQLVCPWHGFEFDVATGRCTADPRFRLRSYQVLVRNGIVYVVA